MLQIAIWGIAIMLIVKGLDLAHQGEVAGRGEHRFVPLFAWIGAAVAFIGAVFLFFAADRQTDCSSSVRPLLDESLPELNATEGIDTFSENMTPVDGD